MTQLQADLTKKKRTILIKKQFCKSVIGTLECAGDLEISYKEQ